MQKLLTEISDRFQSELEYLHHGANVSCAVDLLYCKQSHRKSNSER